MIDSGPAGAAAASRRTVLRAGLSTLGGLVAGAGLGGCDWKSDGGGGAARATPPGSTAPSVEYTADVRLLAAAVTDETSLLDRCTATLTRFPRLAGLVAPIIERQRSHIAGLGAAAEDTLPLGETPVARVPRQPVAARRALLQAVSRASAARSADVAAADSGRLARLFASAAASHAQTVEVLRAAP